MRQVLLLPLFLVAGWIFGSFVVGSGPPPAATTGSPPISQSAQAYVLPAAAPAYAPTRNTDVVEPVIDANAALLVDLDSNRILYEKNSNASVPIASLTKLLSATVASELFRDQDIVTVSSTSVRVDGQKQTLFIGERITIGNLIAMMLVESSNDAAYAIAAYAREQNIDFVARMNQKAAALGMDQCTFTNPAGLDDTAFCSATNLLKLVRSMIRTMPQLWAVTTNPTLTVSSVDGATIHQIKSTNELLEGMEGILGGKTGYTDGALGCLVLVVKLPDKDATLVSIVLGSRGRFADTRTLVSWAAGAYRW